MLTTRNLVMHLLPLRTNDNWKWNIEELAKRSELFNGKRAIGVASPQTPGRLKRGRRAKFIRIHDPETVKEEFKKQAFHVDHWVVRENNPVLREVETYPLLLEFIQSTNSNEVTFCCHGKASTHDTAPIPKLWAETMYHVCLDHWPTIEYALHNYAMVGGFKRYNAFNIPGNNCWHYSGSFYWFRHDKVFIKSDWRDFDHRWFGTESWPGKLFERHEGACLICDDAPDLYHQHQWDQRILPELRRWNNERGFPNAPETVVQPNPRANRRRTT